MFLSILIDNVLLLNLYRNIFPWTLEIVYIKKFTTTIEKNDIDSSDSAVQTIF